MLPRSSRVVLAVLLSVAVGCKQKQPAASGEAGISAGSRDALEVAASPERDGAAAAEDDAGALAAPQPSGYTAEDAALGVNLALAALGGHVVAPTEPPDHDHAWRLSNLIDGFPLIRGFAAIEGSMGWVGDAATFPQQLVFAFHEDRLARLAAAVIDTAADQNVMDAAAIPKDVELWVSTSTADGRYDLIATAVLPETAGETVVRFAPTTARYVKLVITSTHRGAAPRLGEVQLYEAPGVPSIIADVPKNLLLPALGGSLVRFTAQTRDNLAAELLDGVVGEYAGWCSPPPSQGRAATLPMEFTFAFRDHRAAFIDHLLIDPTSGMRYYVGPLPNVSTWAKTIEIQTSSTSPWDGFTTEVVLDVPAQAAPIEVPLRKAFRFLRVRILENHGADRVTLGEVQAFEGLAPGARSITSGRPRPLAHLEASLTGAGSERAARREREPNDSQKEADRVESPEPIGGALTPSGDRDVFLVPGAGAPDARGSQILTVDVEGRPALRARVTVIDRAGITRFELDAAKIAGAQARFSVTAPPGDLFVQVVQPPSAQVVIWDSSGSMEHRVAELEVALRAYLGQVAPSDRVQLIRFDDGVEVLMKDFSGDQVALTAALKGKVYADGGTSIYDAIKRGLDTLAKVAGSRAIVMMTDGEDTTSQLDPGQFWQALDRSRVRLYAIGLGNGLRNYVPRAGATAERVLANAALATGGRYAFIADAGELGQLYDEIGAELRAPATYALAARTATGSGMLRVTSVGDQLAVPPRVELVLDASGSMKRKASAGKAAPRAPTRPTMMDAAKEVLETVVAALPAKADVALRVYGHRTPERRAGACKDSELLVPFGPLDRPRLVGRIRKIKALGTTPLAYSIERAGEELKAAPGPAMLVVVTDGREECGGDPAAAAAALRAAGLEVTVNVVGFALTDPADRAAMAKLAAAGQGRFFDAQGQDELRAAIDQALAVPFVVVDAADTVVARGVIGGPPIAVPVGDFALRLDAAGAPVVIDRVRIEPASTTTVELKKDGNEVGARVIAPGSAP